MSGIMTWSSVVSRNPVDAPSTSTIISFRTLQLMELRVREHNVGRTSGIDPQHAILERE